MATTVHFEIEHTAQHDNWGDGKPSVVRYGPSYDDAPSDYQFDTEAEARQYAAKFFPEGVRQQGWMYTNTKIIEVTITEREV